MSEKIQPPITVAPSHAKSRAHAKRQSSKTANAADVSLMPAGELIAMALERMQRRKSAASTLRTLKHIEDSLAEFTEVVPPDFERALSESNGKPFVFQAGDMRSLHFDGQFMQSAMWMTEPDELTFGYTRAMMGFLLFNPEPRHILMVGLGGGSLAKYCYRYLQSTRITVLEIDADVIALRDKFMIPPDDDRFRVVHTDAVPYIAHSDQRVDVILLDGFGADGIVPELNSQDFYDACRRILNPEGVLAANLWNGDADYPLLMSRLNVAFGYGVWSCNSDDSHNALAFAAKGKDDSNFHPMLKKRAKQLAHHVTLELPQLAARLKSVSFAAPSLIRRTRSDSEALASGGKQTRLAHTVVDFLTNGESQESNKIEWSVARPGVGGKLKLKVSIVDSPRSKKAARAGTSEKKTARWGLRKSSAAEIAAPASLRKSA